jgi:hypothetical protein
MAQGAVFVRDSGHSSMTGGQRQDGKTDGLRFRLVMWFISAMPVLSNPQ